MAHCTAPRRSFEILLFLVLILLPEMAWSTSDLLPEENKKPSAKSSHPESHPLSIFTLGTLIKLQAQERETKAEIEQLIREVDKCDASIARSKEIVSKAKKAGNAPAERLAGESIIKSEKAKTSYLKQGLLANRKLARIKGNKQRLSNDLLSWGRDNVRGAVSWAKGNVTVNSPDRNGEKPVSAQHAEQLQSGDEVSTGREGKAELQVLGGRGSVTMAENSRLKIEDDKPGAEVVCTQEGKFHFLVEKKAAFETELEQELASLLGKAGQAMDKTNDSYLSFLGKLKKRMEKKLQVKMRSGGTGAVRGTEFLVTEHPDGSSEITVIEGSVAISDSAAKKEVLITIGQKISISPDGIPLSVQGVDTDALPRWWEEQE